MSGDEKNVISKDNADTTDIPSAPHILNQQLHLTDSFTINNNPFPSADDLEKIEKICPGSVDKIINMTVEQSKHRQNMESITIKADAKFTDRFQNYKLLGMWLAFIIVLIFFGAGFYLILVDKPFSALITLGMSIGTLAAIFIGDKRPRKPD